MSSSNALPHRFASNPIGPNQIIWLGGGSALGHRCKCVERAGGINECSTGVDGDCDAERFDEFLLRRAGLRGRSGMGSDTTIAAQSNGHGERD